MRNKLCCRSCLHILQAAADKPATVVGRSQERRIPFQPIVAVSHPCSLFMPLPILYSYRAHSCAIRLEKADTYHLPLFSFSCNGLMRTGRCPHIYKEIPSPARSFPYLEKTYRPTDVSLLDRPNLALSPAPTVVTSPQR